MLDQDKIARIQNHYTKATYKHPEFCKDFMVFDTNREYYEEVLRRIRNTKRNWPCAETILEEETGEIFEAYVNGRNEHAIDECYDAIAVLIRMVEFIESKDK